MPANTDGPIYVVIADRNGCALRKETRNELTADLWELWLEGSGWTVSRSRRLRLLDTKQVAA